jgi:TPR repeat protein
MLQIAGAFTLTVLTAIMGLSTSVAAQTPPSRSLAPSTDFSKICAPVSTPKLTRDWSKWQKGQPVSDPEEVYAAAVAYSEGSATINRDPVTARRLLEDLADRAWAGRGRAHFRLGKLLLDPVAGPVDPERAASHLAVAASMLNMDASVLLAKLHEQGRIGAANVTEAERLLRAASTAGHVDGIIGLARLQRSGRIGAVPQAATDDLVKLALQSLYGELGQGKCSALYQIGLILSDEALVPGGLTEAVNWFDAAARQGDAKADFALAEIYLQERVKAAPDLFVRHLERAAEAGEPRAMTLLGERLMLGDRAPKDVTKGITWLERAGLNADPEAYKLLARHYRGEFGAAQDLPKAADALTKASLLPGHNASILVGLARLHAIGVNGKPDIDLALSFYRRAVERGDIGSLTEMAKLLLIHPQASHPEDPMRLLKEAAHRGHPEAMGVLSDLYACSILVSRDPVQARAWMERAAEAGHVRSILAIASQANSDPAVARRNAAALRRAAERGDRESMILLSHAYRSGQGVAVDIKEAERWHEAALAPGEGRARALLLLARRILNGEEGSGNEAAARTLLEQASQEGDAGAQLELGRLLVKQREQSPEMLRGIEFLQKAAVSGNAAAMLALAEIPSEQIQSTGRTALEWRKAAAEAGSARGAILLASAAKDGADTGRWLSRAEALPVCATRDMVDLAQAYHKIPGADATDRARYWMQRALADVQAGAKDPATLFLIGRAMIEGVGGISSKPEAIAYIRLAAEAGRGDAMRYLGRGYASGNLGERNTKAAIEWLSKALHNGDASVAADLARIAAMPNGEGTEAIGPLKESAERGFAAAMREYGRSLQLGFGVPAEPEAGASWLRKAAEAGDTGAMKELSRAYASGYGVELSARASTEWLQRAAQAGDTEAMYNLSLAMTLGFGTDVNASAAQEWLKTAEGAARK